MLYITFLIFLAITACLFRMIYKRREEIERYKFENRTDGGVVQYENYEVAKAHQWKEAWAGALERITAVFTVVTLLLAGLVLSALFN